MQNKREYNKKYYQENKEKIRQKESEIITCECGCKITRNKLARHKKSLKHIKLTECIILN